MCSGAFAALAVTGYGYNEALASGGGGVVQPRIVRIGNSPCVRTWCERRPDGGYRMMQSPSARGKECGSWTMTTELVRQMDAPGIVETNAAGEAWVVCGSRRMPLYASAMALARRDWEPFGPEWACQWTPEFDRAIDERIERHRKADATVDGLAPGAEVRVDQMTSRFLFGSQMFNFNQLGSDSMNAAYKAAFTNLFNAATLAFYWRDFEPEEGRPRFASGPRDEPSFWNAFDFAHKEPEQFVEWRRPAPDRLIEFCRAHGLSMHGHAILYVWPTPEWVFKKATTPELARFYYDRRVAGIARHYGDAIPQWDVVNESLNRKSTRESPDDADNWCRILRKDFVLPHEFTRRAFEVAASNFPQSVRLAINDAWTMQNDAYAAFVRKLIGQGARIDVVGYQKHIFDPRDLLTVASGYPCLTNYQTWDLDREIARLKEIDGLGRPIHISEITIPSPRGLNGLTDAQADEIQARMMRDWYRFWFSWPSVDRITYWNLVDGMGVKHERMSSGWFNRDMSPKRVAKVMADLIKRQWRTHLVLRADAEGRVTFRGFKGGYRLTWQDAAGRNRMKEIVVE